MTRRYSDSEQLHIDFNEFVMTAEIALISDNLASQNRVARDAFAYDIGGRPVGPGAPGTTEVALDDPPPPPPEARLARRLDTDLQPDVDFRMPVYIVRSEHPDSGAADRGFGRVRVVLEQPAVPERGERARPMMERRAGRMRLRVARAIQRYLKIGYSASTFVTALDLDRFALVLDVEVSPVRPGARNRGGGTDGSRADVAADRLHLGRV